MFKYAFHLEIEMVAKIVKFSNDPCFGQKHEQMRQCNCCWIKKSCVISFRNRKNAD